MLYPQEFDVIVVGGGHAGAEAALAAANTIIPAGEENVEAKVEVIESSVPGYKVGRDGDGQVTPESLARGVQALQKKLAKDALEKAKAALA